jgi:WD40 repeat protein
VALKFKNGTILVCNWQSLTVIETLPTETTGYPALKLLYGGHLLATSCSGGMTCLWNLTSGLVTFTTWQNSLYIEQLTNGDVATTGNVHSVQIVSKGVYLRTIGNSNSLLCLKQIPTTTKLAGCGVTGDIYVWDTNTGSTQTLSGHTNATAGLACLRDSDTLVSASWDKTIRLWKISTSSCLATLNPLNSQLLAIQNVTNNTVVVGGQSNRIAFVNVTSTNQFSVLSIVALSCSFVNAIRVTYSNILLIAMDNSQLGYFDLNTNQLTQSVYIGTGLVAMDLLCKAFFSHPWDLTKRHEIYSLRRLIFAFV